MIRKICKDCGMLFMPTGTHQKLCECCQKVRFIKSKFKQNKKFKDCKTLKLALKKYVKKEDYQDKLTNNEDKQGFYNKNKHNTNIYKPFSHVFCMARLREAKKWGNSLVVVLTSVDANDLGIVEGDKIDIEDALVKSKKVKK
jgi:hypothetical protein